MIEGSGLYLSRRHMSLHESPLVKRKSDALAGAAETLAGFTL